MHKGEITVVCPSITLSETTEHTSMKFGSGG